MASSASVVPGAALHGEDFAGLPNLTLPRAPRAALLWSRGLVAASILVTLFTLDRITVLFGDYWLFESLGLESCSGPTSGWARSFYAAAFLIFAIAIAFPAYRHDVARSTRRFVVNTAFLVASVAAYLAALQYSEFLLGGRGFDFGKTDPVFDLDIGFYAFNLPNIQTSWRFLTWAAFLMLCFSVACANAAKSDREAAAPLLSRLGRRVGVSATPCTRIAWIALGILAATGVWLSRYGLLLRDNSQAASIKRGAQYLDVTGLFSTLNYIWVTTFVILGATAAVAALLKAIHEQTADGASRAGIAGSGLPADPFAHRVDLRSGAVVVRN
jgi:hypothetical protein